MKDIREFDNDEIDWKKLAVQMYETEMEQLPSQDMLREKYMYSDTFYTGLHRLIGHKEKRHAGVRNFIAAGTAFAFFRGCPASISGGKQHLCGYDQVSKTEE